MKIIKPDWIIHDNGIPIFSVDAHPSEPKVATSGQSESKGGLIVVWALEPILDPTSTQPKLLCRLDQFACVNCVRWSKRGLLASANDDGNVIIWSYVGKSTSTGSFGSDRPSNIETWKAVHTLRGHSADVLGLDWSPGDDSLASCSVDNSVIVWNANNFPEKRVTLSGHTDMVKGVSWDPIGRFLASQAADRSVRVWRSSDWGLAAALKGAFKESANSTMFLRLAWAPDGSSLVAPHASNNGAPTAQIFERRTFAATEDIVGHRKAVSCIRWSPHFYKKKGSKKSTEMSQLLACGSRDRGVSIWQPPYPRSRCVIQNLFHAAVMDLSWAAVNDAAALLAVSSDGTLAAVLLGPKDVGAPFSAAEATAALKDKYGALPSPHHSRSSASDALIDNPELLKAIQDEAAKKAAANDKENLPTAPLTATKPTPTAQKGEKQQETRTKDGKRRIQPLFLGTTTVPDAPPPPATATIPPPPPVDAPSTSATPVTPIQSLKLKRVRSPHPPPTPPPKKKAKKATPKQHTTVQAELDRTAPRQVARASTGTPDSGAQSARRQSRAEIAWPVHLPLISLPLGGGGGEIRVLNAERGSRTAVSRVKLLAAAGQWEAVLGGAVISCTASTDLVALGTDKGELCALSAKTGARVGPALRLHAPPVLLVLRNHFLCAITAAATIHLWKWGADPKALMASKSVSPLLDGDEVTIESAKVDELGQPIVSLSNGSAFIFSHRSDSWVRVWEAGDPLATLSTRQTPQTFVRGPLATIASKARCASEVRIPRLETKLDDAEKKAGALGFLESKMSGAAALGSGGEFRFWVRQYVEEASAQGAGARLSELFSRLLGEGSSATERALVGGDSRELLRMLLPLTAANVSLQALYAKTTRDLGRVDDPDHHLF